MTNSETESVRTDAALALANRGILHDVNGARDQAVEAWEAASDYADTHLAGADIDYWIKSGLGAALFEAGAYERGIAVSELALDWCSKLKQPLPALTIAKCHVKLGNRQAARDSFDQARHLAGDSVLDQFEPADRAFLLEG